MRHWGLDPSVVFLNHGSFGACPRVVLEAQRRVQELIEAEPIRFFVEFCEPMLDAARLRLAELVGCDAEGIALVPNATAGVNTVLASMQFEAGDELLTNSHEYNACNNALVRWGGVKGARVVSARVPFPVRDEGEVIDAIMGSVTSRTKLAMISHVTSPTGLVMPVRELTKALQARGVRVLIDGAHAPGMVPLNLAEIGAEYYTGNLHKWLCTPKGCAFVHVREDVRGEVRPLIVSHGANAERAGRSRFRLEFDYVGTFDVSAYLCIPPAEEFLSGLVEGGLSGLMRHNRENALSARRVLCAALGAREAAPASMIGALAAVELPSPPGGVILPSVRGYHDRLWDELIERHGIQVPIMPFPPKELGATYGPGNPQTRVVRVAMQAYNAMGQVEYLGRCLVEELGREK
jgi:isopenicillin-N epimerase